jgi:hypothetical protein
VDDSLSRAAPDSALHTRGRTLALFVMARYAGAPRLDSITVMFVRERENHLLSRTFTAESERFSAASLR